MPEIMGKKSTKILLIIGILVIGFLPQNSFADLIELIQQGDNALKTGNKKTAETAFTKALELDPENYRLLKSLGEIKFETGQYAEAEKLVTRILAMPITRGRNVLVHLKGESEPLEAELVDETVMMIPADAGAAESGDAGKFLKGLVIEPIPHYRLFFKKAGKIKLVPKRSTRIEYVGVPPRIHEKMVIQLAKIKKLIIAASGSRVDAQLIAGSEEHEPERLLDRELLAGRRLARHLVALAITQNRRCVADLEAVTYLHGWMVHLLEMEVPGKDDELLGGSKLQGVLEPENRSPPVVVPDDALAALGIAARHAFGPEDQQAHAEYQYELPETDVEHLA